MNVPFLGEVLPAEARSCSRTTSRGVSRKSRTRGAVLPELGTVARLGGARFERGDLVLRFWSDRLGREIWVCGSERARCRVPRTAMVLAPTEVVRLYLDDSDVRTAV